MRRAEVDRAVRSFCERNSASAAAHREGNERNAVEFECVDHGSEIGGPCGNRSRSKAGRSQAAGFGSVAVLNAQLGGMAALGGGLGQPYIGCLSTDTNFRRPAARPASLRAPRCEGRMLDRAFRVPGLRSTAAPSPCGFRA